MPLGKRLRMWALVPTVQAVPYLIAHTRFPFLRIRTQSRRPGKHVHYRQVTFEVEEPALQSPLLSKATEGIAWGAVASTRSHADIAGMKNV